MNETFWIRTQRGVEGPFSRARIVELLRWNRIGSLDEISADGRTWTRVRRSDLWNAIVAAPPERPPSPSPARAAEPSIPVSSKPVSPVAKPSVPVSLEPVCPVAKPSVPVSPERLTPAAKSAGDGRLSRRPVHCPHCNTALDDGFEEGDWMRCPACGRAFNPPAASGDTGPGPHPTTASVESGRPPQPFNAYSAKRTPIAYRPPAAPSGGGTHPQHASKSSVNADAPPPSIIKANRLLWIAAGKNVIAGLLSGSARAVSTIAILGGIASSIKKGGSGRIWLSVFFPFVFLFSGLGGMSLVFASPGSLGAPDDVAAFLPVFGFLMLIYCGIYTWAFVLVWLQPSREWFQAVKAARRRKRV